MRNGLFLVLMVLLASAAGGYAVEIEGVRMPDTLSTDGRTLVLNGAGVRTKYFMELYVGGLYLQERSQDAARIIAADEPMAIRLEIISKMITSDKMSTSTEEGFEASTGGNTAPIKDKIAAFIGLFKEGIQPGDVYEMVYEPGKGVEARKNGSLVSTISGLEFKRALFGIWLCEKPTVNSSLKDGMLGR